MIRSHGKTGLVALGAMMILGSLLLLIAPGSALAGGCQNAYSGGDGLTPTTPYLISTRADLVALTTGLGCDAGDYYLQTADIDISGVDWTPIGRNGAGQIFSGSYDGGGHRITGLTFSAISVHESGLFGEVRDSDIRRLTIVGAAMGDGIANEYLHIGVLAGSVARSTVSDVHVIDATIALSLGDYDVGVLVGAMQWSTVTGSSSSGSVVAGEIVGGLVGDACASSISSSTSSATVRSTAGSGAGGLVGRALPECLGPTSLGTGIGPLAAPVVVGISDSQATGSVSGRQQVGGLVGYAQGVPVVRSFATGAVVGTDDVGGLLGIAEYTLGNDSISTAVAMTQMDVADSYARGAVTGQLGVGGLIGNGVGASLIRSYATGRISGATDSGGLVGILAAGATEPATSFWDVDATGQATSFKGIGKTTAEMKSRSTFASAGWAIAQGWVADTTKTWGVCAAANGGYPYLLREYTTATEPCTTVTGAPTSPKAVAGDGSVVVSWGAPMSDGGASATSYTATAQMQARAAKSCTATAPALTCTIAGLANGRAYTVSIVAINRKGAGVAAVTGKVTPRSSLVVVSARRSGLVAVSRVRVSGAGRVVQVGTVVGSQQVACRVTASVKAAGTVALRCALKRAVTGALATRSLRVRLVTTFRSANGTAQSTTRIVRFARLAPAPSITG